MPTTNIKDRRMAPIPTTETSRRREVLSNRLALARWLAVLAGVELQHGHHAAAERLAFRAESLREGVAHG